MPSRVIDGAALASKIKDEVASRVRALKDRGRNVHLTAVLVGSTHAGELYANRQRQACAAVGIDYELRTLRGDADGKTVAATIQSLNRDPSVSGIMLHPRAWTRPSSSIRSTRSRTSRASIPPTSATSSTATRSSRRARRWR